jgi:Leucine-rich repeat (LRR) protein
LKELKLDIGNLDDALRRVAGAGSLRALTIVGELTEIPESLGELAQVEWLMIDSGPPSLPDSPGTLRVLPDAIGELVNLTTLSIRRNAIDALPDAIGNLTALRTLSLQATRLVELPRTLGDLTKLQTLEIRATSALRALPESLPGCTSLERLEIRGWDLAIANLPLIGALPALKVLSLAWSRGLDVRGILDALAGQPLDELDLRDTRITELPESIGKLSNLRKLELDGTNLKRFPAALRDCTELRYISVPLYNLDQDVRDNLKAHLPKGRWKKHFRSHVTWYERAA